MIWLTSCVDASGPCWASDDLMPLLATSPGGAGGQGQSVSLGLISPLGPGASEGFRERGGTMCRGTTLCVSMCVSVCVCLCVCVCL